MWLFILAATLNELNAPASGNTDATGLKSTLALMGALALWSAYRGWRRLTLLRHGEIRSVKLGKDTYESFDHLSGSTNKTTVKEYRFRINDSTYRTTVLWTLDLRGKPSVDIVYHTLNPDHNAIVSRLRAYYEPAAKEWRSAMWHVIPRVSLLAIIVISAVVILLSGSALYSV
ncbi:hypothetical protein [Cohnella panacarvi]|uniref:hypothetical protein n=1 Tax=Cohnella panacarvi TaxID=400776 RepID=UPI0012EC0192|nr:hypothetical protein [Cohnella panacarvi]